MKISTAIIQNKNIYENNENVFSARYKNHDIYITTYHGHGNPKHDHLNRYNITVLGLAKWLNPKLNRITKLKN